MHEIEAKILNINKNKIIKRLKSLGAKKTFNGIVQGKLFDFEGNSLDKKREILRLRKMGDKAYLTYKSKINKDKVKSCVEKEVIIGDFEIMAQILQGVGLIEKNSTITKKRVSYSIGKTHFDIETPFGEYGFIPPFMEIESTSIRQIYKYAEILGFKKEDCLSWGGQELIKYYSKKHDSGKKL